jgi:hypothetical protein
MASVTQEARQVLLNLLDTYRELETPANPEILRLHIDAATDRLETIYTGSDLPTEGLEPPQRLSDAPKGATGEGE